MNIHLFKSHLQLCWKIAAGFFIRNVIYYNNSKLDKDLINLCFTKVYLMQVVWKIVHFVYFSFICFNSILSNKLKIAVIKWKMGQKKSDVNCFITVCFPQIECLKIEYLLWEKIIFNYRSWLSLKVSPVIGKIFWKCDLRNFFLLKTVLIKIDFKVYIKNAFLLVINCSCQAWSSLGCSFACDEDESWVWRMVREF